MELVSHCCYLPHIRNISLSFEPFKPRLFVFMVPETWYFLAHILTPASATRLATLCGCQVGNKVVRTKANVLKTANMFFLCHDLTSFNTLILGLCGQTVLTSDRTMRGLDLMTAPLLAVRGSPDVASDSLFSEPWISLDFISLFQEFYLQSQI